MKYRRKRMLIFSMVCLLGFTQAAGQPVWAASLDELEQQKQQTQQDAQDAKQDLEDAKDRTDSLQEEAEALEGEYRSLNSQLQSVAGQISDTEEAIATTSEDIDDLNAQLAEAQQKGVKLITEKDLRWQHCDVNTLNRLPEVMARQKAAISGAFDAVFVRDGKITETTESSFMLVKDEVLWTAPENENIHKNITRKVIKERLALDLGMPVVEKNFDVDFALKAEEAFICGPRYEIVPVVKIDRKLLNGGEVGKVVPQLLEAYKNFVAKECPAR